MALSSNFSGKKCLVVADSPDLARLVLHSLRQVGLTDGFKADGGKDAKKQLYKFDFDILICAELAAADYLEVLKTIRFELPADRMKTPVVCLSQNWDGAVLAQLRDGGITFPASLPFSLSSLLKILTRCFSDSRSFITSADFRGPDRRLRTAPDYAGPKRRAADAIKPEEPAKSAPSDQSQPGKPQAAPRRRMAADYSQPSTPAEENEHFYGDPTMQQTKVVIDDAIATAKLVTKLSQALAAAKSPQDRANLLHDIAETAERMVNLLTLANARIEAHGCDDIQLGRLGDIKAIIVRNTEGLAEAAARRVIDYGTRILSGKNGFPLGALELISHQMMKLDTVIQVIGGTEFLSDPMKELVGKAKCILTTVAAKEAEVASLLPEIEGQPGP
jgi:two-component system chemotaxis response regulator CheY